MTTSGRILGEFLRLLYFISNKQAVDYFADLGYEPHKEEFCHRRGVFFHNNRCTLGMACAQAVVMRGAPTAARRLVAAPRNQQPHRSDPHEFVGASGVVDLINKPLPSLPSILKDLWIEKLFYY